MKMVDLQSSNIAAIGYDPETRKLMVHFKSGGRYMLHDVEPVIYEQFLKAESPGSFYSKNIRGFYEFNRLEDK